MMRKANVKILLAGGVVVAIILIAIVAYRPMLEWLATRAARQRGIELDDCDMNATWGEFDLSDCKATLVDVRGVALEIDAVTIETSWFEPTSVNADGVAVMIDGSAAAVAVDISQWAKNQTDNFHVPVEAKNISITWKPNKQTWLAVKGGTIEGDGSTTSFRADKASLMGVGIERVRASWDADDEQVVMTFAGKDVKDAKVRVVVRSGGDHPTADITLEPAKFVDLAGPLGVVLPLGDATVEGGAHLVMRRKGEDAEITGTIKMVMNGYRPPLPVKLAGLSFGDRSTFDSKIRISDDRGTTTLSDAKLVNGSFALTGGGTIRHKKDYAEIALNMKGEVSCAQLAAAAATEHGGLIAGLLAGGLVEGTITVGVNVKADTRALAKADVSHELGIGCGI